MTSVKSVAMSAVGRRASRRRCAGLPGWALILAVLLGVLAPAAQAAPFVTVWMEARINGSGNAYTTAPLAVAPGQKIDYQIWAQVAPVGTSNSMATAPGNVTITNLAESGSFDYPGGSDPLGWLAANGINGMKFNLYQNSADPIQATFQTAGAAWGSVTLNPSRCADAGPFDNYTWTWGLGIGANKGQSSARAGGPSTIKNLNGIRPILSVGVYGGVDNIGTPIPMMIISGTTAAMSGTTGKVDVTKNDSFFRISANTPSDALVSTTMRVNGQMTGPHTATVDPISEYTSWTSDPVTVYNGITLYTPWAEAHISNAPSAPIDLLTGAGLTLDATVGFSSHTTLSGLYHWEVHTAGLNIDTPTPELALTNAQLNSLYHGNGLPEDHTATVSYTTADGALASDTVHFTLTPEPATLGLLAVGLSALIARRRR